MSHTSIQVENTKQIAAQRVADLLLDIGTYLLSSGAHCGRVNRNLSRIADTWGFEINIDATFKGLLIKVRERRDTNNTVTAFKMAPSYKAHLSVLTHVSNLVWKTFDHKLSIDEVERKFEIIKKKPSYNSLTVAIAVGFSCAGLCFLSGGDILNAIVALVGASLGFIFRVQVESRKFNSMIAIGIASFITTMITGAAALSGIGIHPQAAMATAVLYLIPGVPLINCVIDLIDGYLSAALNRGLFAGFILLCIATGMALCITILGINNFN